MNTYTKEQLKDILDQHKLWLEGSSKGKKADLSDANLFNADLSDANLSYADLYNANLRNANLTNANLSYADLRNANLSNADLSGANLYNANLRNADLSDADLRNANLRNADLYNANLSDADLRNANLSYADLRNANLFNAKFNPVKLLSEIKLLVNNNKLVQELMVYDMLNLPNGKKLFNNWKEIGTCPFNNSNILRACLFNERRDLWSEELSNREYHIPAIKLLKLAFDEMKVTHNIEV